MTASNKRREHIALSNGIMVAIQTAKVHDANGRKIQAAEERAKAKRLHTRREKLNCLT